MFEDIKDREKIKNKFIYNGFEIKISLMLNVLDINTVPSNYKRYCSDANIHNLFINL
jgi:hypothetical protein